MVQCSGERGHRQDQLTQVDGSPYSYVDSSLPKHPRIESAVESFEMSTFHPSGAGNSVPNLDRKVISVDISCRFLRVVSDCPRFSQSDTGSVGCVPCVTFKLQHNKFISVTVSLYEQ